VRDIGTSTKALDGAPTTGSAPGALCSCCSQRRTRLALRPWVSATAATEAPGCWQSEMTWRLRSGAWRRRVRFVGVLCMVSTYLLGGHYPHASGLGSQDAFTGRILTNLHLLLLASPMLVHALTYLYVHKTSSSDDWAFWKELPKARWWFAPLIALIVFLAIFAVEPPFGKFATLALITIPSAQLSRRQYLYLKAKRRLARLWSASQILALLLLLVGLYFVFFAKH